MKNGKYCELLIKDLQKSTIKYKKKGFVELKTLQENEKMAVESIVSFSNEIRYKFHFLN